MDTKVVLITGAGRGLGRSIAEAFLTEGFYVIATDVDKAMISESDDIDYLTTYKLDVTSEKEMRHCAAFVTENYGRLDVLVSNAGIFDFYPVSEAGAERLKQIMDVNFLGLANLTKYFLPLLMQNKGRLIVISSESYKVPAPFQPYAVSKQALESIYKAIKIELSLKGIKSILIRPGAIQTKILDDTIQFSNNSTTVNYFNSEFANFIKTVPNYIGNISSTTDIAKTILRAGTVKRPKAIYSMNHNPLVSILSMMPVKLRNYLIRRNLK